jgi:hypothetical protein
MKMIQHQSGVDSYNTRNIHDQENKHFSEGKLTVIQHSNGKPYHQYKQLPKQAGKQRQSRES